jgi:protein-tyrosine-phosphatase
MALDSGDPRPTGLTDQEKYRRIFAWYRANRGRLSQRTDDYARRSADYIDKLPDPASVSPEQIADAFKQVRTGVLEWAYHESDGQYKMAAYAGA